jgi:membrane peptidoglycan carboxypeptidase
VIATGVALPAVMPAAKLAKATADEYGAIPPLPGFLPKPPERSTIVAADGSTLANLYLNEDRRIVKLKDIPLRMQNAVLAIEDSRFYQHEGVDYQGIARAVVTNAETGGISQGGSTLTQQYVKLVITGGDVTLKRKVQEAVYALELEKRLGKAQILERYLNLAYFGEGVYGVATAAEHYFSKPLKKLTLGEMAALAATIARPETFKPTKAKANTTRRALVLNRMRDLGYEKAADTEKAKKAGAKVKISKAPDRFPYFYTYIRGQLLNDKAYDKVLGKAGSKQRERAVFQGGLKIHTTLEPTRQKQAERAVKRQLAPAGKGGPTGALASVEPHTGKVVALVGGRDYSKSEVNLAVLGRGGQGYQPGSSFKPFFAIAALEQGLSPRLVLNAPSSVEIRGRHCPRGWRPGGGADQSGSGGRIDMYEATARSVNTYYAQLADKVGPEAGLEVARKLGISGIPKREDSNAYAQWAVCSLVLGVKNVSVLDMAAAYGVLANDGVRCPRYTITKITGPDGKDVWKHKSKCERVLSTRVSRTTTDMMRGGPARGTGTRAQIGRPLAGKTGTAQNYTSAFFDGFTPQLATAVWVGYPGKPKPMGNLFQGGPVMGGTYPALIFRDYMSSALAGKPVRDFPRPPAPPSVPMPDVLGKSAADAKRILEAAGLSVTVSGKGKFVTASSPAPGARVAKGSQVEVALGDKPKDKVKPASFPTGAMPSVIGMTLPEAFGALNGAGIQVQVRGGFGRVIRQFPAAGTRLGPNPVATLWAGGRGG